MKKKFRALLALIVCAAMLYTGLTASAAVTVSAATPIKSTINMAKTKNVTVVKGNRYKMKAVINGKTITTKGKWSSSNRKIATVDKNGVITAVKAGNATIKVTYKGKFLRTVVKIKATCVHKWKVTKKATCETKGTQTCSVCGVKESIAKTKHSYVTETGTKLEGRGKSWTDNGVNCGNCGINMTDWTDAQIRQHIGDLNNWDCFNAAINYTVGIKRYEKYFMVRSVATYCKYCGEFDRSRTYDEDLYECDGFGNRLTSSASNATKAASNAAVATASVATFADAMPVSDINLADTGEEIVVDSEIIIADDSEDIVISGNEILSDNNITDLETGNEIITE